MSYTRHDKNNNPVDPQPGSTDAYNLGGSSGWKVVSFKNFNADYEPHDHLNQDRTPGTYQARNYNNTARTPAAYQRYDQFNLPVFSSVNLLTSSRELDNAVWGKQNSTVTPDVITAPDGTLTPDLLVEETNFGSHSCRQSVPLESGKTYKFSIYVKANSLDHLFLVVYDTSFNTVATTFDLTNETSAVATGSPTSHSITAFSDGWFLVSMTFTASATDTYQADIRLSKEGNWSNRSYTGTGESLYLWRANLSDVTIPTIAALAFLEYTTVANTSSFTLRATNASNNYEVDWGDGTVQSYTSAAPTHTYATAGTYTIKITPADGTVYNPFFVHAPSDDSIAEINGTGGTSLTSLFFSFWGASNLTSISSNIDTSNVTDFNSAWRVSNSLTTFPVIDTSNGESFNSTWQACTSLTSFPELDFSSSTDFAGTWAYCSSLSNFPADMFDNTGTITGDWSNAFRNCALTVQSIENILVSLDTNGLSNNTLGINGGSNAAKTTWTTAANTAYTNLINKGWTITYNA